MLEQYSLLTGDAQNEDVIFNIYFEMPYESIGYARPLLQIVVIYFLHFLAVQACSSKIDNGKNCSWQFVDLTWFIDTYNDYRAYDDIVLKYNRYEYNISSAKQ